MTEFLNKLLLIEPLTWPEVGSAILCGGILGFERQLWGKAAGIRTSVLICLGTYVFVKLGVSLSDDSTATARVIGQVITGIGFVGAGVILSREGQVRGITSASVIWMLAALGSIVGTGNCITAILISVLAVIVLVGVDLLENSFKSLSRGIYARISKNGKDHSEK